MLNPEVAQQRLQTLRNPDWRQQKLQQMLQLPEALRETSCGILGFKLTPKQAFVELSYELREYCLKQIETYSASDRLQVFEILFPRFATAVEAAWQLLKHVPYQIGYTRCPFRTPDHPAFTLPKRSNWLLRLTETVEGFDQDLPWFARWTPYLTYYAGDTLGLLFAAAINQRDTVGQEVQEILLASACGEHEIGAMGRHVTRALLTANYPEGWEFIEKLLLAAQRQEGLRQTILETIDEAHPQAFVRLLRLILDEKLTRFSATIRAVDVWFGFGLESLDEKRARGMIQGVLTNLEDPASLQAGLRSSNAETVYLSLWAAGFNNAVAAIALAEQLLNHPEVEHRFVATHFLRQLGLAPASLALLPALSDSDLGVAGWAMQTINNYYSPAPAVAESDAFERMETVFERFPTQPSRITRVWEWTQLDVSQELVASALLANLGERSPKRLIPYLNALPPYQRGTAAELLAKVQPWDDAVQDTLLKLVGDASAGVQERVIRLLHSARLAGDDYQRLEQLLTRKSSTLRRGILGLFLNQSEPLPIAQRLLGCKAAPQRQAGLELLKEMVVQNRRVAECQTAANQYQATHPKLSTTETQLLQGILEQQTEASLTDALGLAPQITPLVAPVLLSPPIKLNSSAAEACLLALDELVHEHRQTPVKVKDWNGREEEMLLGNITWQFPHYDNKISREENLANLPLADLWLRWWQERPDELRDPDGLELLRALAPGEQLFTCEPNLRSQSALVETAVTTLEDLFGGPDLIEATAKMRQARRYNNQVCQVLNWLLYLHPPEQVQAFGLDAVAALLQALPIEQLRRDPIWCSLERQSDNFYAINSLLTNWISFARCWLPANNPQSGRWWQLLRWYEFHFSTFGRNTYYGANVTTLADVFAAHNVGSATEADIVFHLLGAPGPKSLFPDPEVTRAESDELPETNNLELESELELMGYVSYSIQLEVSTVEAKANLRTSFHELGELTRRKPSREYADMPILLELADQIRQRVLEVELQRGDLPTAASHAARALRSVIGIPTVLQLLQALEQAKLVRGYSYGNLSKPAILSHLMRVSFPAAEDTPAEFAQQVKLAKIAPERLIQLAVFAPQWANYVQEALGWPGFTDAVWWFHAHTKDSGWSVEADVRETWAAQISERTPLDAESLVQGAVDVDWFRRAHQTLKPEQWQQLYEAAQYAASGQGHQRAKQFADAMLGQLERTDLIKRIAEKRHQDSVRALGLLPLSRGKQRSKDLLERYELVQEFLRTSKKFGSQRQGSEKTAATIGLENLARTAGYIDPQRLQWAMELLAMADLAKGPATVTVDAVSVSLAINPLGDPELTITKNDKPLKSIPAVAKKHPQVQTLTSRKQDILRQASRMRQSLEQAMCRGDQFTAVELAQLAQHPVLYPMLVQLIWVGEPETGPEIGFLAEQGRALQHHDGTLTPIQSAQLRLAHAHDLLLTGEWHLWQQDCFSQERAQPFKQVFRELYVSTPAELEERRSRRYEGQQVNPRQATALFGQRGWLASPEEGVRRSFHSEKLIASVEFLNGYYTPLDVEGLTIAGVRFYRRDEWQPLKLSEIPPLIFSEVMRDLDLVASVAHQGSVDPEATSSTVEMRSSLVRETCRLLKLSNVQLQGNHVLIEGKLGSYSIHLGSATVHRQPGGALCILPVHAQHRGRVFLPFVDNDPKTAEVISKVILLARDQELQDPTILQQIL